MDKYQAIQESIRYARIQRSVYLAEVISGAIVATWKFLERVGAQTVTATRAKTSRNVFTFDA
jgi:hypothetical protein